MFSLVTNLSQDDKDYGSAMISHSTAPYKGSMYVYVLRATFVLWASLLYVFSGSVQQIINVTWQFLHDSWLFNSVYFETFFTTFCYGVIVSVYPKVVHACRFFEDYKISQSVCYVPYGGFTDLVQEMVVYVSPLMLLDTVMVKKYHGVDPSVWVEKRANLIQTARALPDKPPTVSQICFHIVASLIVFDALFFVIHLIFHKNFFLYKNIHAHHHDHYSMYAHVTNRLAIPERVALILSANESLKVFNSHPLTRMIFVPIFIAILVDNHLGYDLPFSLHRFVPFRIVGGSLKHFAHHIHGSRDYEPILTYLDKLWNILSKSK